MTLSPASGSRFGFVVGAGVAHQIGLGLLLAGYAACRTQFLPFCL